MASLSLPPFGPPVLKPGLHLRVRHLEVFGQGGPLRGGQVLLLVEPFLKLADLDARKGGSRLLALGRGAVLVGVTNSAAGQGERAWKNLHFKHFIC